MRRADLMVWTGAFALVAGGAFAQTRIQKQAPTKSADGKNANTPATRAGDTIDDAAGAAARGAAKAIGPGARGPTDQAASTRSFLGLGVEPDKIAAARGAPVYAENCAGCHGPDARGGIGPNLLYSTIVLDDDHGEKLRPFLHVGRPEKGMPPFAALGDKTLTDIAEFLHLRVENYANRGTYKNTNDVMTGNATAGAAYFAANCTGCHSAAGDMKGVGARFRPLDLQKAMIVPSRGEDPRRAVTAIVTAGGAKTSGRVTRIDDFEITLVDAGGATRTIKRDAGVRVVLADPLEWHDKFAYRLKDRDMTDLVTYLGKLK